MTKHTFRCMCKIVVQYTPNSLDVRLAKSTSQWLQSETAQVVMKCIELETIPSHFRRFGGGAAPPPTSREKGSCVIQWCELLTRLQCRSTSMIMAAREDVLCTIAAHPCPWVPTEGFWSPLHHPNSLLPDFFCSLWEPNCYCLVVHVRRALWSWKNDARWFMPSSRL